MSDTEALQDSRKGHEYDVDKRFAHIRVELLGQEFTDVVRVNEQIPDLPDGITVYVDHVDAVDLKQDASDEGSPYPYPRVRGECPECGGETLFVGEGGYVTCSLIGCKNPSAPSEALGIEFNRSTDTEAEP